MRAVLKACVLTVSILTILTVGFELALIQPVHASPGSVLYRSYASSHTASVDYTVTNPLYAYDQNNSTFADLPVPKSTDDPKYFEITNFNATAPGEYHIENVQLHMNYSVDKDAKTRYKILFIVGSANNSLKEVTASETYGPTLQTWSSPNTDEPNDGKWTWSEIASIQFRVELEKTGGGGGMTFEWYEAWVSFTIPGPANVFVDPVRQNVGPLTFPVRINISDSYNLYNWSFQLAYDTNILTAINVVEGGFLSGGGSVTFQNQINDAAGTIKANCTLIGDVAGVSGSGTLATITFDVDSKGSTSLTLSNTKLTEYDYTNKLKYTLLHTSAGGFATVVDLPFKLSIDPTSQDVTATFHVNITVSQAEDFYGWELKLVYNTTAFTATDSKEGPFLNNSGPTYFTKQISDAFNSTHGTVYIYCTLLGDILGVSGSGLIANVTFSSSAGAETDRTYPLNLVNETLTKYDYVSKIFSVVPRVLITDATVTYKGVPVPEFPLGLIMEISLIVVIVYVWRKTKHKTQPTRFVNHINAQATPRTQI